nr:uncharacterized protein LOC108006449 [Drosophila suzukii]
MSNGQMTNQLNLEHPLLSAIPGNNYAQTQRMHYYPNHYYPSNYFPGHYHQGHQGFQGHPGHQGHPGQLGRPPLQAAASSHNGAYAATAAGSGHSGYGSIEPSVEYELPHDPPSGSFSSYHPSSAGSGPAYPPHHPQEAPPPPPPTKSSKKSKKTAGSVMNALTLLSFFFFVNLLQNCLKDHMADMNPTVMVLTASGTRNRFNKLAEMNSREQTSTTATESAAASSWNLNLNPNQNPNPNQAALVPAVEPSVPPSIVLPTVVLQSPYSGGISEVANKPHQHQQSNPQQKPHDYRPHIVDDDYNYGQRRPPSQTTYDFYPNRTHIDHSSRPDFESESVGSDYYQHHYNPYAGTNSRRHPWSYGRQRYSSAPWSSASLGAQSGVSSYLDNAQRRQGDDDDGHGYGYRDGNGDGDRDGGYWDGDEDEDGQQRRRGDAFYTRTRIN